MCKLNINKISNILGIIGRVIVILGMASFCYIVWYLIIQLIK